MPSVTMQYAANCGAICHLLLTNMSQIATQYAAFWCMECGKSYNVLIVNSLQNASKFAYIHPKFISALNIAEMVLKV